MAWAVGWATVNVVSFVANQYLRIPLDETFYIVVSLALGAAGIAGVVFRRGSLRLLLRRPFLPADLGHGFGLGVFLLFLGFLAFVVYKSVIIFPAHPDELIYHMQLPKVAWQTGFLPLHPGIDLTDQGTAYPDLLVTQQLWVYLGAETFDPVLVRAIVPTYTALLMLLVFFDTRRWFGLATAGVATAALFSVASFASLTTLLMDEIPVAFYGYLGLRFAIESLNRRGNWYLAGLFMGFAALVKYDGLAALAALGVALLLASMWRADPSPPEQERPAWKTSVGRMLGFFAVGIAPAAPILLRNLRSLGNPIYPYFFGGVSGQIAPALLAKVDVGSLVLEIWSSEIVSLLATLLVAGSLLGLARVRSWTPTERLLALFIVFYLPPYLSSPLLGSQIRYLAPVLAAMAIFTAKQLTWWLWDSPRPIRIAGALVLIGIVGIGAAMVLWAPFYGPFNREVAATILEVFAVSTVFVLGLLTLASRRHSSGTHKAVTYGLILVLLVPGVIAVAAEQSEANPLNWQPNLLPQTEDAYLSQRIGPDWTMWNWMNANLPANATVLSFDPRVFYIDARLVSAMSPEILPTYNMTLSAAVAYVRGAGIGYVLDSTFGNSLFLNYLYIDSSPIFQNLTNPVYFRAIHQEGTTVLYALR